jgi:peroxiredoxin
VSERKKVAMGQSAGDFHLTDTDGKTHQLSQYRGSVVVIVFWSAECPVSTEYDPYFNQLLDRYADGQVLVLGIDSNVNYGQAEILQALDKRDVRFPVLRDPDSAVADRFGAVTTPHTFIIDAEGYLVYEGAVDDRTFRQREATVNYVDQALIALLAGNRPPTSQTQPYGCTIVRYH